MRSEETIDVSNYCSVRGAVGSLVSEYYRFILEGGPIGVSIDETEINCALASVERVVEKTGGVYHRKRYLSREFDHPGRMVMYSSYLLSQILDKGKRYDLLVNLLNGSAEMGLAIQAIDSLLGLNHINSTVVFEVDFARYSKKDEEDEDVNSYSQFERIAIPKQLRPSFRENVDNKDVLIVDDNINTGSSLHNVRTALEEIAKSVDISVAEVTIQESIPPRDKAILTESDLTYPPIAWWRDQRELNRRQVIPKIIGLYP
jgi:hypoxanthine phosphoribosyltransferase